MINSVSIQIYGKCLLFSIRNHGEDEFTLMNKLHEQTKVVIPENLRDLDKKEIRHKDVINKEDMKKYILEKLGDL